MPWGRLGSFVAVFRNLLALILAGLILSGCETAKKAVKAERDNRGGYADSVSDKLLLANTHKMRVLRAYAVTAALSGLALETGLVEEERQIATARLVNTMEFLKGAKDCADKHPGCVFIDTRMFDVNKSLFLFAKTVLPVEQLKELIDVSSFGISTVRALLRLGGRALKGGLRVAAIYRDTWDLYMIVYRDYLIGQIATSNNENQKTNDRLALQAIDRIYHAGSGDIRKWKVLIRDSGIGNSGYRALSLRVVPNQKHFNAVIEEIKNNCKRIAEDSYEANCSFQN